MDRFALKARPDRTGFRKRTHGRDRIRVLVRIVGMASNPGPFAPRLVRERKRRAAKGFREAAFLHRRVAADLADRLEAIPRPFARALALGGGGLISEAVRARGELSARIGEIIEADLASGIEIDPEHLPFAEASFDLVVSPLALHTVNDLPGALIQIRR